MIPTDAELRKLAEAATNPWRWFSYDGDCGYETHDSEEEARRSAEAALEMFRDDAPGDGWDEDSVTQVCWGVVIQEVEEISRRKTTPEDCTEHEEFVDYGLRPILSPFSLSPTVALSLLDRIAENDAEIEVKVGVILRRTDRIAFLESQNAECARGMDSLVRQLAEAQEKRSEISAILAQNERERLDLESQLSERDSRIAAMEKVLACDVCHGSGFVTDTKRPCERCGLYPLLYHEHGCPKCGILRARLSGETK
jgi:energy-coupling factor transporter ATP-binding protein EcfA2